LIKLKNKLTVPLSGILYDKGNKNPARLSNGDTVGDAVMVGT